MASSLIGGSIAIILILVSGYVVATGLLTIAESSISTQTEMKNINQDILQSRISILYGDITGSGPYSLTVGAANNGSTTFGGVELSNLDLYVGTGTGASSAVTRYSSITTPAISLTLVTDYVNRNMWDEGEIMNVTISGLADEPHWVKLSTSNGVGSSYYL